MRSACRIEFITKFKRQNLLMMVRKQPTLSTISALHVAVHYSSNGIRHMQINFTSDSDLVLLCRAGDREAWNEFFRRFLPLIKSSIRRTLKVYATSDDQSYYYGLDAVSEITEQLVIKLYPKGILDQLVDISGLHPWLRTVVTNLTIDWLIAQGRLKHAARREVEGGMLSLDKPLNDDTDTTLADTLALDIPSTQEIHDYLEMLLQTVDAKSNRRDYWIVRLSIISQIPLELEEESALADFSPLPPDSAQQLIQSMIEDVERRTKECDSKLGLAIVLGSELRRLQYVMWEMRGDDTPHGLAKIDRLKQECICLEKRRIKLLVDGMKIPRPRNSEISALVGIVPEQESQVSTVLTRSRKYLRKLAVAEWDDEE